MSISPFDVLGVKPGCTKSELREVYKDLILKVHPDKHDGNNEMFNLVVESYNIIVKYHLPQDINDETLLPYDSEIEREELSKEIDFKTSAEELTNEDGKLNNRKFNELFDKLYERDKGYDYNSFNEIDQKQSLVIHQNPESVQGMGSCFTYDKTNDFSSGSIDGLEYTDFNKAYTDTTAQNEQLESYMSNGMRPTSISALENQRSQSLEPSAEEIARNNRIQEEINEREKNRIAMVMEEDELARKQFNYITKSLTE